MDYNDIEMTEARPAMTVTPEFNDATGEFVGLNETTLSLKDRNEAFVPEDIQEEEGYQEWVQQMDQQAEENDSYTIEEIDQMFDGNLDQPDQHLAEVAWGLELPSADQVPGLDVVQILSTKYLTGEMTQEEALDAAFAQGLSAEQLARAYTIFNKAYTKAIHG